MATRLPALDAATASSRAMVDFPLPPLGVKDNSVHWRIEAQAH
jgi:hypothetical protein